MNQGPGSRTCLTDLTGRVANPFNATCEAVLTYSDDNFLPVTFIFEPIGCSDIQLAQLTVPPESPDGGASVSLFVP